MLGDRARAVLDILDDMSGYQVPLGSAGEAAIHTEHFHELSLLRKILLRMRSWQNYVLVSNAFSNVRDFLALDLPRLVLV